jgi:Ig-like domain from next to BRCA1 gene
MSASRNRLVGILALVIFVLCACNFPRRGPSTQSEVEAIFTTAAQTRQAQLTATSGSSVTSVNPTTPGTPGAGSPTPQPGTPVPGSSTSAALPCDRVKLIADVTYPDDTEVAPGVEFVKTWRLQNAGSCTWTPAYTVVFSGGEAMGASPSVPLTAESVAPGEKVDVSITMKAPDSAGKYRGNWKLRNASGADFGIGPNNKPFWVQVIVVAPN